jgi:hypothetical protein
VRSALEGVEPVFRAVAEAVAPDARRLDDAGWGDAAAIVGSALAGRPARTLRQLRAFLRVLDLLPLLRWGRRFRELDIDRRTRVLRALQDAPLLLLRRGVWGVRTLALMGVYARPAAAAEIGYRAHPRGWLARPGARPGADP